MLFRKLTIGIILTAIILLSACAASSGSITIIENLNETGFTMDFTQFSTKNKCKLSLGDGDVLQIDVTRDSGKIALTVSGKNGSEPYTGNDLKSGMFTITVSETDEYVFQIIGKEAEGKIIVKNLGRQIDRYEMPDDAQNDSDNSLLRGK